MASPVVTVTAPVGPLLPGSPVEFTWTAVDPDTRSLTFDWAGVDEQGNTVNGTGSIQVQDNFTMNTFTFGGVALLINNTERKATGVVPIA